MHIWERKEIENYLLEPTVIARVIAGRTKRTPPSPKDVHDFLLQSCEDEKDTVFDAIATHLGHQDRSLGAGGANKAARELLAARWEQDRLLLVSGKALLGRLSAWAQEHYGVALGPVAIAKAFHAREVPKEVREIITAIEGGNPF